MEHKTIETQAKPVNADLGEFEAIAAAWSPDRERDVIHRGAFTQTIRQWRRSGKQLPLHWDHKGDPDKIIGHIDPQSMRETDQGLFVKGQIDLEGSQVGREAWRLIKNGVVGLSFGYLPTRAFKRQGGGRDLHELDMFEVSITPAPMHPDTRILAFKNDPEAAVKAIADPADQRQRAEALEQEITRESEEERLPDVPDAPEGEPEQEVETQPEPTVPDVKAQRRHAEEIEAYGKQIERKSEEERLPDVPDAPEEPAPEPEVDPRIVELEARVAELEGAKAIDAEEQRKRARQIEREQEAADLPDIEEHPTVKTLKELADLLERKGDTESAEPFSSSTTSNWVARHGGLPHYVQHIAHDLMESHGMDESKAIQMAIGITQRWARGEGKVTADTRAKAAAAVADWEKMRAASHAGKAISQEDALAGSDPGIDIPPSHKLADLILQLPPTELAGMYEGIYASTVLDQPPSPTPGKHVVPEQKRSDDADVTDRRFVDPLRNRAEAIALEYASGGESLRKSPPPVKHAPKPEPELSLEQLHQRMRDEMLIALSGGIEEP